MKQSIIFTTIKHIKNIDINDIYWIGQGDNNPPPEVENALLKAIRSGKQFYSNLLGINELREEISNYYSRHFDCFVSAKNVAVTSSGAQALAIVFAAILSPRDEVVAVSPLWPNVAACIHLQGANLIQVPLTVTDRNE